MNIGLALVFGVLYWLATNKLWYGTLHLVRQPLVLAVPIGLIMGNLGDAMKIGASLQMIYLGAIAPGGTLPADEALASCITIPVALAAGLEPDIAVTIAVPVGLLGVLLDNLKRTYHSYFVHLADKAAEKGDMKAMGRAEFWYPFFCSIPLCSSDNTGTAVWNRCRIRVPECDSCMGDERSECGRRSASCTWLCGNYHGHWEKGAYPILYSWLCDVCLYRNEYDWNCGNCNLYCNSSIAVYQQYRQHSRCG